MKTVHKEVYYDSAERGWRIETCDRSSHDEKKTL